MRHIKQLLHSLEDLGPALTTETPSKFATLGMAGCVSTAVVDAPAQGCERFRLTSWKIAGWAKR
jgi:hypothetical protein